MTDATAPFQQLVFSGGGTRCFWQGGFLDVVRDVIGLRPARISGVSGGALSAACFIARRGRDLLERMSAAFAAQDSNINWNLREGDGLSPHQRIYQEVVSDILDAETQEKIAEGPAYQVLIGHPPLGRMATLSGAAATLAYEAELHLISRPHFNWAERVGVTSTLVDARAAAAEGRLAELVCAAAVIPPVFTPPDWDGQPVIDGGMADQAPMPRPDEGRTLVLLTRKYRHIPRRAERLYLHPARRTPADKIDFTDPQKIRDTWEAGALDGRAFLNANSRNGKEEK